MNCLRLLFPLDRFCRFDGDAISALNVGAIGALAVLFLALVIAEAIANRRSRSKP